MKQKDTNRRQFLGYATTMMTGLLLEGCNSSATTPLPTMTVSAGNSVVKTDNGMTYLYNAPESKLDVRYNFQWEILKMALESTVKKYGPYQMEPAVFMSETRQAEELKNNTGLITTMYLDTTPEFERELIPVRIPVDKNLVGYRIFLIRKEDQPKFSAVNTLDELRQFSIGLGLGWVDVDILEYNKFKVVTGSSYDGLFDMLISKRFDAFSRSMVEILDEYEQRKAAMPEMHIEESLILYYPLPMYFWFSKSEVGQKRAERVQEGMFSMIEDGRYDQIFEKYQSDKIHKLNLKNRKVFKIENQLLVPETPFNDKRLWFDPLAK